MKSETFTEKQEKTWKNKNNCEKGWIVHNHRRKNAVLGGQEARNKIKLCNVPQRKKAIKNLINATYAISWLFDQHFSNTTRKLKSDSAFGNV